MDYKLTAAPRVFTLTDEHGASRTVQRLGAGTWCTAYRDMGDPTRVYLSIKEDPSKEILRMAAGPHVPQLEQIGYLGDNVLWRTTFYHRLTAKHRTAWKQFRLLQRAAADPEILAIRNRPGFARNSWGHDTMQAIAAYVDRAGEKQLGEALARIADAACNYGLTYVFEFAVRNLAVDTDENLILLDPVFNMDVIEAKYNEAAKRRRRW